MPTAIGKYCDAVVLEGRTNTGSEGDNHAKNCDPARLAEVTPAAKGQKYHNKAGTVSKHGFPSEKALLAAIACGVEPG